MLDIELRDIMNILGQPHYWLFEYSLLQDVQAS